MVHSHMNFSESDVEKKKSNHKCAAQGLKISQWLEDMEKSCQIV